MSIYINEAQNFLNTMPGRNRHPAESVNNEFIYLSEKPEKKRIFYLCGRHAQKNPKRARDNTKN